MRYQKLIIVFVMMSILIFSNTNGFFSEIKEGEGESGHVSLKTEEFEGKWAGIMVLNKKQGDAEIAFTKTDGLYTATYRGLPSFSGPLYNVRILPGKRPNTMTVTMTSHIYKGSVLRFYLLKESDLPQLHGVVVLDYDVGKDLEFSAILERQPCCDPKCIHPGKSRCY